MPKLSPTGRQNGHFGHYLGNHALLHKCSRCTSIEMFWCSYLCRKTNWAFLANILWTGRDTTFEPCSILWIWSFCVLTLAIGLCILFGSRDIPISKFGPWAQNGPKKRGFPRVDFGGLFSGFYDLRVKNYWENFSDLLHNLFHSMLQFRGDTIYIPY